MKDGWLGLPATKLVRSSTTRPSILRAARAARHARRIGGAAPGVPGLIRARGAARERKRFKRTVASKSLLGLKSIVNAGVISKRTFLVGTTILRTAQNSVPTCPETNTSQRRRQAHNPAPRHLGTSDLAQAKAPPTRTHPSITYFTFGDPSARAAPRRA